MVTYDNYIITAYIRIKQKEKKEKKITRVK